MAYYCFAGCHRPSLTVAATARSPHVHCILQLQSVQTTHSVCYKDNCEAHPVQITEIT